jgi:hypothetical protein
MFSAKDSRLYSWQHRRTTRHDETIPTSGLLDRLVDRPHRDHSHLSYIVGRKL